MTENQLIAEMTHDLFMQKIFFVVLCVGLILLYATRLYFGLKRLRGK